MPCAVDEGALAQLPPEEQVFVDGKVVHQVQLLVDKGNARVLWGQDPKSNTVQQWLLNPLPQAEINKQYGLVQNPGW